MSSTELLACTKRTEVIPISLTSPPKAVTLRKVQFSLAENDVESLAQMSGLLWKLDVILWDVCATIKTCFPAAISLIFQVRRVSSLASRLFMPSAFVSPVATISQAGVFVAATLISSVIVILALLINSSTQSLQNYVPDPTKCTCDCWDGKFKGGYGHGGYKHAYFQMDFGASLVWIWTVWNFALLYEFVKRATVCVLGSLRVVYSTTHVRWGVLLASTVNFYGMFYNWWITFNYLNDLSPSPDSQIHVLAYTQFFFNITDLIPAMALYTLLPYPAHAIPSNSYELMHGRGSHLDSTLSTTGKSRHQNGDRHDIFLSLSMSISVAHAILSLWDQGLVHILSGRGAIFRDVALLASDIAGFLGVFPFLYGRWHRHSKKMLAGSVIMCGIYAIVKSIAGYDE